MNSKCYVYKLKDLLTGKYYVGSNYDKNCNPTHIGTSYFTSSKIVRELFRKDTNRFSVEILYVGKPDEVLNFETSILKGLDARNDPNSYNCHNNENNLNSRKVGELTKVLNIGVHGRTAEKIREDTSKAGKISCDLRHSYKDSEGKSIFARKIGASSHKVKDHRGKSSRMVEIGKRTMGKLHELKDDDGKSAFVMRKYVCLSCGFKNIAMMVGKHQKKTGHIGRQKDE